MLKTTGYQSQTNTTPRRLPFFIALALVGLTIFARLLVGPRTTDDAFITFRYARNLAAGAGFVYNPGQRVLGTTTPLFTMILALADPSSAHMPWVATSIGILADAITAMLIFVAVWEIKRNVWLAALSSSLWVISAGSIRFTAGGMETGLFTALLLASGVFLSFRRFTWATLCATCACLVRPEGVIALALVLVLVAKDTRRIPWKLIALSAFMLFPWVIFATLYFGSPIPNSLLAKSGSYHFPPLTAAKSLLGYVIAYVVPVPGGYVTREIKYGLFLILVAALGAFWGKGGFRGISVFRLFLGLFPCIYGFLYAVANPPVWEWYAIPLVPFLSVILVVGLREMLERAGRRLGDHPGRVAQSIALSSVFLYVLGVGAYQLADAVRYDVRQGRELAYMAIAERLTDMCVPTCSVAAPEIGALGFYLEHAEILDTQGLVSPEVIPYREAMLSRMPDMADLETMKTLSAAVPGALIADMHPHFIISLNVFTSFLEESDVFANSYDLLMSEPSHVFGSTTVVVFQRVVD